MTDIAINRCNCGINPQDYDENLTETLVFQDGEWQMICNHSYDGCGRVVFGDSKYDVVDSWNAGISDDFV